MPESGALSGIDVGGGWISLILGWSGGIGLVRARLMEIPNDYVWGPGWLLWFGCLESSLRFTSLIITQHKPGHGTLRIGPERLYVVLVPGEPTCERRAAVTRLLTGLGLANGGKDCVYGPEPIFFAASKSENLHSFTRLFIMGGTFQRTSRTPLSSAHLTLTIHAPLL